MSESPSRRAANFTSEEIDLLIDLVKSKKDIIECKKTDRILWKDKDTAWENIATQFNLLSGQIYRSTGGGPSSHVIFTHVDEEVKDLLGVRLEGLPSYCDSDTASTAHEHAREEVIVIQGDALPSSSKESQETTWESHAPSMLSEPVSAALKRPIENEPAAPKTAKKRKVTGTYTNEKWSSLADDKANYVALQTRCLHEEHSLKMDFLLNENQLKKLQIEEQQLKNELLRLEIKAKEKYM
ncbi:myb/sant-like dna-binding domain [Holotrichia oblita]|uniref:Myb/sant-like dna-binding domain n=1 Tax=Holotrichia oblita TaxID=644536 RepID=A0ACB9SXZ3_HOLOL|nr:myb/sant-like dna-binding domain [Holotrichia oblita]